MTKKFSLKKGGVTSTSPTSRLTIANTIITSDSETIAEFYEEVSQENKRTTALQYSWHVYWFTQWLQSEYNIFPDELDLINKSVEKVISNYLKQRYENQTRESAAVAKYALRKLYYKFLKERVDLDMITLWGETSDFKPTVLTRDEVTQVMSNLRNHFDEQWSLFVAVGYHCAMRRSEVVALDDSCLKPGNILACPISKTRKGKTREKNIELPSEMYKALQDNGFLKGVSPGMWSSRFSYYVKEVVNIGDIRWHDFARHTRLTHYAEDTKNFFGVLQLSGHQNPAVAKQYFEMAKVSLPEMDTLGTAWWNR